MTENTPIIEYSFEKKKKLAAKIGNIKNKEQLRTIRDIIFEENPNAIAKKTNDGYLMYFQNYTPDTYIRIEKNLNKNEPNKNSIFSINHLENTISDVPINTDSECSKNIDVDYVNSRSRLRYSNRERRLINKRDYDTKLNEKPQSIIEVGENNNNSSTLDIHDKEPDTVVRKISAVNKTKNNTNVEKTIKITSKKPKHKISIDNVQNRVII